ncbi:unnamed protein product [Cunninghamella blakesleeana]
MDYKKDRYYHHSLIKGKGYPIEVIGICPKYNCFYCRSFRYFNWSHTYVSYKNQHVTDENDLEDVNDDIIHVDDIVAIDVPNYSDSKINSSYNSTVVHLEDDSDSDDSDDDMVYIDDIAAIVDPNYSDPEINNSYNGTVVHLEDDVDSDGSDGGSDDSDDHHSDDSDDNDSDNNDDDSNGSNDDNDGIFLLNNNNNNNNNNIWNEIRDTLRFNIAQLRREYILPWINRTLRVLIVIISYLLQP